MLRVFLGGTCNGSLWRDQIIPILHIEYFNPVVDDWTEDDRERELYERYFSDFCLYTITPKMIGVYAIAEVVDDSNKKPYGTVFVLLSEDGELRFTEDQLRSLNAVAEMVKINGGQVFDNLDAAADYINRISALVA